MKIRPMIEADIAALNRAIRAQGWSKPNDIYARYWQWEQDGTRRIVVAELDGQAAGYLTLKPQADNGPYAGKGIPEIEDLIVFEAFQRRGVGDRLMDAAEALAAETSSEVCLGVGLHSGYGSAQRMYAKRGYVPHGSGVWFRNKPLKPYAKCVNDDDLVLYQSKSLRK